MGKPNNALGVYMNKPDRIRSVLEYYLGEHLPDDWVCEERRGMYSVRDSDGRLSVRQRDYLGKAHAWGTSFLLGLENQQNVNLTYPWRLMELDCLTYGQEIQKVQEENLLGKASYGKGDDFLYRYRKGDRLEPVVDLMLYWGREKWEGPLSLRGMMGNTGALPEKVRRLIGDYTVCMIPMRQIPEEALCKMESDLKYVLGIMRRAGSQREYEAYIRENRAFFSRIPRSAFDAIDACVDTKNIREQMRFVMNRETKEEEADMCEALIGIERSAEKRGLKRGRRQGLRRGRKQGRREGLQEGRLEGIREVNSLMQQLLSDGRQEDLLKAAGDSVHLEKLLVEYMGKA